MYMHGFPILKSVQYYRKREGDRERGRGMVLVPGIAEKSPIALNIFFKKAIL